MRVVKKKPLNISSRPRTGIVARASSKADCSAVVVVDDDEVDNGEATVSCCFLFDGDLVLEIVSMTVVAVVVVVEAVLSSNETEDAIKICESKAKQDVQVS